MYGTLRGFQDLEEIAWKQDTLAGRTSQQGANIMSAAHTGIGVKIEQAIGFCRIREATAGLVDIWCRHQFHDQFFAGRKGSFFGYPGQNFRIFQCNYTFFVHDNIDLILYVLVRYKVSYEMNSVKIKNGNSKIPHLGED